MKRAARRALDDLYGEGSAKNLLKQVPGAPEIVVVPSETSAERIRIDIRWEDAYAAIQAEPKKWRWLNLHLGEKGVCSQHNPDLTRYRELCEAMPSLAKSWGVEEFEAFAGSEEGERLLMTERRWERVGQQHLCWRL